VSAALAIAQWACAVSTLKPSVYGRVVTVKTVDPSTVAPAKGELIAVGPERIVVLDEGVREVPLAAVEKVEVKRHGFGFKQGMIWTVVGAAVTGAALTLACSRESTGCGRVFATTTLIWGVVGGLSAASLESSSKQTFRSPQWGDLRPFARFPQGLPGDLDLKTLAVPRAEPGR
jgi:hypothetical protein